MYWQYIRALACITFAAIGATLCSVTASAQATIKLDGSMGSMPLVQALGKAFQTRQPRVAFEFGKGMNPKERIEALAKGTIDVALASHGLNIEVLTRQGMRIDQIARTAVVFAANASVDVESLSDEQICGIFAGRFVSWKDIGGPDLAIAARARPENEVDTEVVRDGVACLKSLTFAPAVKIVRRGSDMTKDLAETQGAIGMTTTTVAGQSGGKIKALALNGVIANDANVSAGKYGIVREVFLVVTSAASPAVREFLAYIRTPEGAAIIKANGALPTTPRT